MQNWGLVLMMGFMHMSIISCFPRISLAQSDTNEAASLVSVMEQQVKLVAEKAATNYANRCGFLSTCGPENCSKRECYPLKNSNNLNGSQCVYMHENKACLNKNGTYCNWVRANLLRSTVRVPAVSFTFGYTVEKAIGISVCAQRELDSTFAAVYANIQQFAQNNITGGLPSLYNIYFGSVEGSLRVFPSREVSPAGCNTVDPRSRPWFTGAISVVKDVVVLLDTSTQMQLLLPVFTGNTTSLLKVAKSIATSIWQTLTAEDRATIVPFNDSGVGVQTFPWNVSLDSSPGSQGSSVNTSALRAYLDSVGSEAGSSNDNGARASNFTAAFLEALQIVGTNNTESQYSLEETLKIVILLTDGNGIYTPSDEDLQTARGKFEDARVRLFVYELGARTNTSYTLWSDLACQINGYDEKLDPFKVDLDPMSSLTAYFTFLARSRIQANNENNNGSQMFWQIGYMSASGLGNVTAATYPVMSADNELIGVVGLDIQLAGFHPSLILGMTKVLLLNDIKNEKSTAIPIHPQGVEFLSCSGYNATQSECDKDPAQVFCTEPDQVDSTATYASVTCCNCNSTDTSWWDGHKKTFLIALPILLLGAILIFFSVLVKIHGIWMTPSFDEPRPPDIISYSYQEILDATDNLSIDNRIGDGLSGKVYRGRLPDGSEIAVKMLEQRGRTMAFQAEIDTLGITSHPNLVKLKGRCEPGAGDQYFLVYEFVNGGTLGSWLWPNHQNRARFLTWAQRRQIAWGTARGLTYLHVKHRIFHLDIKPDNIVLDLSSQPPLNPKIIDFGLSKLYKPGFTTELGPVYGFTPGYVAPEVVAEAQMSRSMGEQPTITPTAQMDVYSFGMVLLELMSGVDVRGNDAPGLLRWARRNQEDGLAADVVLERRLISRKAVPETDIKHLLDNGRVMIDLALRCLSDDPSARPPMHEVLETIETGLKPVIEIEGFQESDQNEEFESDNSEVLNPHSSDLGSVFQTSDPISVQLALLDHVLVDPHTSNHTSRSQNSDSLSSDDSDSFATPNQSPTRTSSFVKLRHSR